MSKNTSVVLGRDHQAFIKSLIRKGQFGSASEAIRAGIRLLENEQLRLERLRRALEAGEASGEATAFDVEEFIASKRRVRR